MASVAIACIIIIPFYALFLFIKKAKWNKLPVIVADVISGSEEYSKNKYKSTISVGGKELSLISSGSYRAGDKVKIRISADGNEVMTDADIDNNLGGSKIKELVITWIVAWVVLIIAFLITAGINKK